VRVGDRPDVARRKALAVRVLRSVDGFDPVALALLGAGLRRADGPWAGLGSVFAAQADARAAGEEVSGLAVVMLARWIRLVEAGSEDMSERLIGEEPEAGEPWAALAAALLEQREHVGSAA
jgi:hypothetical protein